MIFLEVISDVIPEPDEVFKVKLTSIETTGLSQSGKAILDKSASIATLSLGASDNPHGLVEFSLGESPYRVRENVGQLQLTIVRHFGKMGKCSISDTGAFLIPETYDSLSRL